MPQFTGIHRLLHIRPRPAADYLVEVLRQSFLWMIKQLVPTSRSASGVTTTSGSCVTEKTQPAGAAHDATVTHGSPVACSDDESSPVTSARPSYLAPVHAARSSPRPPPPRPALLIEPASWPWRSFRLAGCLPTLPAFLRLPR